MSQYFPLKVHTHFSLSTGLSMPTHVARRCRELGLAGCAMTDSDSISGSLDFLDAMKGDEKVGKAKLKGIVGCEFTIVKNYEVKTKECGTLVLIAKNYEGWLSLARSISKSNTHYWNDKAHITIEDLADTLTKDSVIAIAGWLGSDISDNIFINPKEIYLASSIEDVKSKINTDWLTSTTRLIAKYKELFGENNFYLGLQLIDSSILHASNLLAQGIRYLSKKTSTRLVAVPDSYYAKPDDAYDQRVLLVNKLNSNFKNVFNKKVQGEDISLVRFFNGINYHIPSYEEMINAGHTEDELNLSLEIASLCEAYSLENKPKLPQFPTPNGLSSADYLKEICREGWIRRWPQISTVIAEGKYTKEEYVNRFNTEFAVLTEVGLSDYFLIVDDIIKFAISDGQLTGAGRGSAAGSLILYLLGVTHVDPIEYDLLFERFYNAGRNTKDNISLPDVDMDFEKGGRERVLAYTRQKYGHDKVAQMITFNRMQGRGAFKDIVRAHDILDNETVNRITKLMPNEPEIADQLQAIKEADKQSGGEGEASIIEWALENNPEDYKEWVYYDDNGKLQGSLSKIFEQAIRMEGTKRASGKHAAGIVISQKPLKETCPMAYDSSTGEMITALEMTALERRGEVKFDFLGISSLDKDHAAINHLRTGRLYL